MSSITRAPSPVTLLRQSYGLTERQFAKTLRPRFRKFARWSDGTTYGRLT